MGKLRGTVRVGSRSLVQASSSKVHDGWPTRFGYAVGAALGAGFLMSAILVFGIIAIVVGDPVRDFVPEAIRLSLFAFVAVGGAYLDTEAARRRGYSRVGLRRQMPKGIGYSANSSRRALVAALIWGLDTGTAFSTFRVSTATWVAMCSVALGLGPWWIGIAYACGFALPVGVLSADKVTIGQLNPRLGMTSTARDDFRSRTSRWAPPITAIAGALLTFTAMRLRRLEHAASRHLGINPCRTDAARRTRDPHMVVPGPDVQHRRPDRVDSLFSHRRRRHDLRSAGPRSGVGGNPPWRHRRIGCNPRTATYSLLQDQITVALIANAIAR